MKQDKSKRDLFRQMFITRTYGFIDISKKEKFWKELSEELDGEFKITQTISRDLERLTLRIPYRQSIIKFSESDTQPLKIECILSANKEFEFIISVEDSIEKLLKLLGQQDIEIGEKPFDDRYLIKGKNINVITHILSEDRIKQILYTNNVFSFGCKFQKKDNTLLLFGLVNRTINSKNELSEIFTLFCLTMDKMHELKLIK